MKRGHTLATGLALGLLVTLLAACAPAPAPPAVNSAATPAPAEEMAAAETVPANARPVQLPTVTPSPQPTPTPALDPQVQQILDGLGNQGPAPELTNQVWINSQPLKLADLRGQVVIVEFWTYG